MPRLFKQVLKPSVGNGLLTSDGEFWRRQRRLVQYFDQPEQFVPERWADGFEKQLPKGAYFPFAMGPRVCIGNTFALMEARLVLAAMAQRYRLAAFSFGASAVNSRLRTLGARCAAA